MLRAMSVILSMIVCQLIIHVISIFNISSHVKLAAKYIVYYVNNVPISDCDDILDYLWILVIAPFRNRIQRFKNGCAMCNTSNPGYQVLWWSNPSFLWKGWDFLSGILLCEWVWMEYLAVHHIRLQNCCVWILKSITNLLYLR